MSVPSIREISGDNYQLTRIARLNLCSEDEEAYKAALVSEYQRAIGDLVVSQNQPAMVPILRAELDALLTLSTEELAQLPERQPPITESAETKALIAEKLGG